VEGHHLARAGVTADADLRVEAGVAVLGGKAARAAVVVVVVGVVEATNVMTVSPAVTCISRVVMLLVMVVAAPASTVKTHSVIMHMPTATITFCGAERQAQSLLTADGGQTSAVISGRGPKQPERQSGRPAMAGALCSE
jgi:hypothetical protein